MKKTRLFLLTFFLASLILPSIGFSALDKTSLYSHHSQMHTAFWQGSTQTKLNDVCWDCI